MADLVLEGNNVEIKSGAPGGTRTPGLLVRSQSLYPTELRAPEESDYSNARDDIERYGRISFCLGAMLRAERAKHSPGR